MKHLVLAVCAVALLAGERAQACEPCDDFSFAAEPFVFRRAPLPANARVLVSGSFVSVVGDVDGENVAIPFEAVPSGSADGSVYASFEWTAAPGTVTITSSLGGQRYEIGSTRDVTAPTDVDVEVTEGGRNDACCPNVATTLTPSGAIDDDGTMPQVLALRLSSAAGERVVHVPYNAAVGVAVGGSIDGCLRNDPLAVDGEEVQALVSTIDWAGNESAPARITFVYREVTPVVCLQRIDCTQTGTSAWASLAVLALLRRRKR